MLDFIELYVPGEILIGLFILGLIIMVLLCVCIYLIIKYELVDHDYRTVASLVIKTSTKRTKNQSPFASFVKNHLTNTQNHFSVSNLLVKKATKGAYALVIPSWLNCRHTGTVKPGSSTHQSGDINLAAHRPYCDKNLQELSC